MKEINLIIRNSKW